MKNYFKEKAARKAQAAQEQARIAEQARRYEQEKLAMQKFLDESGARPATLEEYVDWLEIHLKREEGKSFQYNDYNGGSRHPWHRRDAYIIKRSAYLPELDRDETRLRVIVPEGVSVTHGGFGVNALLLADGEIRQRSWNPGSAVLYKDVKEELERRGYTFERNPGSWSHLRVAKFPQVEAAAPASVKSAPFELPAELRDAIKNLKKKKLTS